jgi:organic radical activating enzyme
MKFPWYKYTELPVERINTLQIFITNDCNLKCTGCFARNIMGNEKKYISIEEYKKAIEDAHNKGCKRVTLIGGEPLLHPDIKLFIDENNKLQLKTTIYTNGTLLNQYPENDLYPAKLRVSLYCKSGKLKSLGSISIENTPREICFMVSRTTTTEELLETANDLEKTTKCKVFFISSLRELDNPNKEFFDDTDLTMPVLEYKKLVHDFLNAYDGNMEIHISKRGVFESTVNLCGNKCKNIDNMGLVQFQHQHKTLTNDICNGRN